MITSLHQRFFAGGLGRWFAGREAHERVIIATLVVTMSISLLWITLWKPISDWQEAEDNRYHMARITLDWMQANEAAARAVTDHQSRGDTRRSILPVITGTARAHGLSLNRVEPGSNGAVSVTLQGQAFNTLVTWLNQLQTQHKLVVQRIVLEADDEPGTINAQVRLN